MRSRRCTLSPEEWVCRTLSSTATPGHGWTLWATTATATTETTSFATASTAREPTRWRGERPREEPADGAPGRRCAARGPRTVGARHRQDAQHEDLPDALRDDRGRAVRLDPGLPRRAHRPTAAHGHPPARAPLQDLHHRRLLDGRHPRPEWRASDRTRAGHRAEQGAGRHLGGRHGARPLGRADPEPPADAVPVGRL